jgi:hypothetical protein
MPGETRNLSLTILVFKNIIYINLEINLQLYLTLKIPINKISTVCVLAL